MKPAESPEKSQRSAPLSERIFARLYAGLMSSPRLLRLAVGFGRAMLNLGRLMPFSPLTKDGKWIRKAPFPPLSKWTRARDLPILPKKTFHEIWAKELSGGPRDGS